MLQVTKWTAVLFRVLRWWAHVHLDGLLGSDSRDNDQNWRQLGWHNYDDSDSPSAMFLICSHHRLSLQAISHH